jgi:molybdenum cofactor cytidylyltransferase
MIVAAMVLGAGGSARMGRVKQLMVYEGKSFLLRAIETAKDAGLGPIVTVLGEDAEGLMAKEARGAGARVAVNGQWRLGMGTSIRAGLAEILAVDAEVSGVMVMLCDQPLVTAAGLRKMLEAAGPDRLVAAGYDGTLGVPACFGRAFFGELSALKDGEGAKGILLRHREKLAVVATPEAEVDIDDPATYAALCSGKFAKGVL